MKKQQSFNHLGNELIHELRNNINNSEGPVDISNHFSYTTSKLLQAVFADESVDIQKDSIIFAPESDHYFKLNNGLADDEGFMEVWKNSDLPSVVGKFAEASYHRYLHHNKHQEKTNKKIRNGS
ncbi:MAG: hypothetical protein R6U84_06010 [Candidatus Cloacimonadales bacterium]